MCGIFGWSFKNRTRLSDTQRMTFAGSLALANTQRGEDSWGFVAVDDGGIRVRRGIGSLSRATGIPTAGMLRMSWGHTRYATVGAVTRQNAHPFDTGSILLAHNGGVHNYKELNAKYDRKCQVDSEHLALHLSEGLPMSEIEGYGAIEWWDKEHEGKQIFLCRMAGGSLSAASIRNKKKNDVGVAWSSDRRHLETALDLACLDYEFFVMPEEGHVYRVEDGVLYKTDHAHIEISRSTTVGYRSRRSRDVTYYGYDAEDWIGAAADDTGEDFGFDCVVCKHKHWSGFRCYKEKCECTITRKDHDLLVDSKKSVAGKKDAPLAIVKNELPEPPSSPVIYTRDFGKLTQVDHDIFVTEQGVMLEISEIPELQLDMQVKGQVN